MEKGLTWPPKETVVSTPSDSIVFDFDNDGLLDVFVLQQKATYYPPGGLTDSGIPDFDKIRVEGGTVYSDSIFYTLKNTGQRNFETKMVNLNDLPNRYYYSYHPFDVNGDGYLDLVSHYFTFGRTDDPNSGQIFSTTIFIGNGRGEFSPIEGVTLPSFNASHNWGH